ncbi:MAG: MoxR family ATPase [Deltaproteobacteria bacterium]|uniref:MoxR family ATPase n=1 Tax=Candidatus Zymogenus saltonus TaxID=2844893 RepID=A0A9D8KEA1_9DELT|nr:MoxR family ATPase [Candidatus Zymogenus saltonus]
MSNLKSIEDVIESFKGELYIVDRDVATVVYISIMMGKPILVEGPAGVGKTELGKVLAKSQGLELIRLQCYEGLDEAKALYEWEYAKQLLYTQILKEKIGEVLSGTKTLSDAVERIGMEEDAFFSTKFILPRPLLKSIMSEKQVVLLVDEIDKADPEFEAFLLEILSDFQVSIPEIGTIKSNHIPQVILTSNNTRDMSDALKRRCLHLYMDFPSKEREEEIIMLKVPGITEKLADQVVKTVRAVRDLDVKKLPSISETLDWAKALLLLNIKTLDAGTIESSLNFILKYQSDIEMAKKNMKMILESPGIVN